MSLILQGLILGFTIVFPGMSGGTVIVILGLYDKLVKDLLKLNLKPYLLLIGGAGVGIFAGGFILSFFFIAYRDIISAFFLGCLWASVRTIMKEKPVISRNRLLLMFAGLLVGFFLASEPVVLTAKGEDFNFLLLFLGGIIATATMLIPGVSGSAVLIIMGIYDNVLYSLNEIIFSNLIIFAAGSMLGIFLFTRGVEKFYFRFRVSAAYLFAGLIIGSSRVLWPFSWNLLVVLAFIPGFLLVWHFGGAGKSASK